MSSESPCWSIYRGLKPGGAELRSCEVRRSEKWLRHTFNGGIVLPGSAVSPQDWGGRGVGRGRKRGGLHHTLQPANTEWETAAATESHSHFSRKDLLLAATCAPAANNTVEVQCVCIHHYLVVNCCVVVCVRWWRPRTRHSSASPLNLHWFSPLTERRKSQKQKKKHNVAPGGCQWPCGAVTPQQHIDRLTDVCSPCARVPF